MDSVVKGEQVESELNSFIRKRDQERRKQEGDRPEEALYLESVRRHHRRQQLQQWWEALRYHECMIRAHIANTEAVVGRHRAESERYRTLLEIDEQKGEAA